MALVVDYTLTVAVSTAAGTAALTSAFPALSPATVPICLAVLAVITLLNLRGLGYAARAFLLPTMVFIVGLLAILAIGLLHPLALHAAPLSRSLLPARAMEPVGLLLLLKAFSAGCSALTGVEAIANGVPLFKPPRVRRAKRTELLLDVTCSPRSDCPRRQRKATSGTAGIGRSTTGSATWSTTASMSSRSCSTCQRESRPNGSSSASTTQQRTGNSRPATSGSGATGTTASAPSTAC
jgi:hypothetical protein